MPLEYLTGVLARRLTRIKPGYYTPPHGPVFVPGVNSIGLIVVGLTRAIWSLAVSGSAMLDQPGMACDQEAAARGRHVAGMCDAMGTRCAAYL